MADFAASLDLARRFRENADVPGWPSYTSRMLQAAAEIEAYILKQQMPTQPATAQTRAA